MVTSCPDHAACLDREGLERLAAYLLAVDQWIESTERLCGGESEASDKVNQDGD